MSTICSVESPIDFARGISAPDVRIIVKTTSMCKIDSSETIITGIKTGKKYLVPSDCTVFLFH